jgi:hypothetical protein
MSWEKITYGKEYSCLAGESKSTANIAEGSICYEVDTTKPEGQQVAPYKFLQGDWRKLG